MNTSLAKFESMLKTNDIIFFDLDEFEDIVMQCLDMGRHTYAKIAIKLGLEQHPYSIDLKFFQLEMHLFDNDVQKASLILADIEKLDPYNFEIHIQRALINSKSGNHEEAIINLKKALSLNFVNPPVLNLMGMEYLYLEDYENARINFQKNLDVDIENLNILSNIVYCYEMQLEHTQAISFLKDYVEKNPYCEVAWHQLGCQYFIISNFKEALNAFEYAILIDEQFIGGYLEKAKTLESLGEYQQAIDNYLITINLDDPTAFVYLRIGECFEKLQKYDAAISYLRKAIHEDPLLEKGWFSLTNIYFYDENYEKAAYYIAETLKIDDNNADYWKRYSEIKMKLNFYEEAISGFKKCLKLGNNTLTIYTDLADVLSFIGEFDNAVSILFIAQRTYKQSVAIQYRLAGLFFTLDRENDGFKHLLIALNLNYDEHTILNEIYPTVLENKKVQKQIKDFKKK